VFTLHARQHTFGAPVLMESHHAERCVLYANAVLTFSDLISAHFVSSFCAMFAGSFFVNACGGLCGQSGGAPVLPPPP
jgi:hypothetical protein